MLYIWMHLEKAEILVVLKQRVSDMGAARHTSGRWDLYVSPALCVAGHWEILEIFK